MTDAPKELGLFSPLVASALVVDLGAGSIAIGLAANWGATTILVIEYGFSRSYQSAAGFGIGGGISAILFGGIAFLVFLVAHLANVDLLGGSP